MDNNLFSTVVKVIEGGLKFSVHRSIWEQVYLSIDREKRGVAKALVDGMFARISEGIGSVVLYFWLLHAPLSLKNLNLNWISWIIICLIILWIGLTRYLSGIGCDDINDSVDFCQYFT
ncbi:MAG: hypothetical protein JSW07_04780 [bacterium]|nr:MAG: hypothetical protein JSW07_04780 [bacterium]